MSSSSSSSSPAPAPGPTPAQLAITTLLLLSTTGYALSHYFAAKSREEKRRARAAHGLRREANLAKPSTLRHEVTRGADGSTLVRPVEGPGGEPGDDLVQYESGKHYVVDRLSPFPVKRSKRGVAKMPSVTVSALFAHAAKRCADKKAMVSATGKVWTWREYYAEARNVGKALISLGMAPGGAINVLGFNSPEWLMLDVGVVLASGMAAGVYTSNGPDACKYLAQHSKAILVGVENEAQLRKYASVVDELPDLKAFVVWDAAVTRGADLAGIVPGKRVLSWAELVELGRGVEDAVLDGRIAKQEPGQACTLIYTSGTTGNPKAVAISHDNIVWTALSEWSMLAGDDDVSDEEGGIKIISYLPLSHIAGQMLDIHAPMFCSAYLENSCATYFADSNALKGSLLATLVKVRPTYFFGVPRVWEKFQAAIVAKGKQASFVQRKLSAWARAKALENAKAFEVGGSRRHPFLWGVARTLLKRARAATGLDRARVLLVAAAPISVSVLEFFASLNMPVDEIWGLSECCGPHTQGHALKRRFGSCGAPMPGMELRLDHVAGRDKPKQGEICIRGRHIMMGYLDDEKKTKEAIDAEGWLHTGDVGEVDEHGMVYIVGRIKELIIGAGGENIAPVPIEQRITTLLPALSNAVMIGDKRKYMTMLVSAKCAPREDGSVSRTLDAEAKAVDPACATTEDAAKSAAWRAYVQRGIDEYNAKHAVSGAQKIVKWTLVLDDFSVANGALGPTLKLKRNVVSEMYAKDIEAMYPPEAD